MFSAAKSSGFPQALKLFKQASSHVPAYKDFLHKHGVKPRSIRTKQDFAQIPHIEKQNYTNQYSLQEMCWGGSLDSIYQLPMSSGTSGLPHFWPTSAEQEAVSGQIIESLLVDVLKAKGRVLFVVSFGMGGWKAGLEFYNAGRWVASRGHSVTVITPGLDMVEVIKQIKALAPSYEMIVMVGYPPFVKDILTYGSKNGVEWPKLNLRLITAGEAFSERWREYVMKITGIDLPHHVVSLYGMAEVGALAHESPGSVELRRNLIAQPESEIYQSIEAAKISGIYQYSPKLRYFETTEDNVLLVTAQAGLPLIRYYTRDRGGLITPEIAEKISSKASGAMVYLFGRDDLSAQLYAVNIYIENIKAALETPKLSTLTTGIFVMQTKYRRNLDQYLAIEIELAEGKKPTIKSTKEVTEVLVAKLRSTNAEYNKLYSSIGEKAAPAVSLKPNGEIGYLPGKKHKWVKRS